MVARFFNIEAVENGDGEEEEEEDGDDDDDEEGEDEEERPLGEEENGAHGGCCALPATLARLEVSASEAIARQRKEAAVRKKGAADNLRKLANAQGAAFERGRDLDRAETAAERAQGEYATAQAAAGSAAKAMAVYAYSDDSGDNSGGGIGSGDGGSSSSSSSSSGVVGGSSSGGVGGSSGGVGGSRSGGVGGSRSGGVGGSSSGGVGGPLDDGWDTFGGRCAPRLRAAAPPLLYNFLMCPSACLSSVPFFFCVPASKSPWSSMCRLQSNSKRRVRPPL